MKRSETDILPEEYKCTPALPELEIFRLRRGEPMRGEPKGGGMTPNFSPLKACVRTEAE